MAHRPGSYKSFMMCLLLLMSIQESFQLINVNLPQRLHIRSTTLFVKKRTTPPVSKSRGNESTGNAEREISFNEMKGNMGLFVNAIKQKSQDGALSFSELKQVQQLLEIHIPHMNGATLSATTQSIGNAYNNARTPWNARGEINLLKRHIPNVADNFSPYELVSMLVGMAKLQAHWDDLKDSRAVTHRLSEVLPKMDERFIGDAIWALGSMDARWESMPYELQRTLVSAIEKKGGQMNCYSLSSTLWAMAKMGMKWTQLSSETREQLPQRVTELCGVMSPQQSSKVLWALGSLGVTAASLPGKLIECHVINVGNIKKSQLGSAVPASQTLTGLAKMGLQWKDISPPTRTAMWDHLIRVCQSSNDRGIANSIWAMGTMGAPVLSQPKPIQEAMLLAAEKVSKDCAAWALCNIVWGLAKMGFGWFYFSRSFRETIMQNIIRLKSDMNSVDTGILLWSLGTLDTPLDTLPEPFVNALLSATMTNLEGTRAQELSRAIWGLSLCGISWDSLPGPLKWDLNVALRRVGETMTPQDVANCAYGLAILSFDTVTPSDAAFRGAHEVLLTTIRKAQKANPNNGAMNEQELEQIRIFSHYLKVMNIVTDSRKIPEELLKYAVCYGGAQTWKSAAAAAAMATAAAEHGEEQGSRLQRRVVRGLQEAFTASELATQYEITTEESSFNGVFPIDAMISKKGKVVALLEVDGPTHYRADGKLRRKDLLKEAMYLKVHPDSTFHRIRWDEANKLGSDIVGAELAALVMSSSQDVDPFTALTRSVQKSVQNFLNWGLRNSSEL